MGKSVHGGEGEWKSVSVYVWGESVTTCEWKRVPVCKCERERVSSVSELRSNVRARRGED